MPIRERSGKYEVAVRINKRYIYLGHYEDRRIAELMEEFWHRPLWQKKKVELTDKQKEIAELNGVSEALVQRRIRIHGYSIDRAITEWTNTEKTIKKYVKSRNKTFLGLTDKQMEIAKENNLSKSCLYQRIVVHGWAVGEALHTKRHEKRLSARDKRVTDTDKVIKYMLKHLQTSKEQLINEFPDVQRDEVERIWNTFQ